jgi:hypothetical protein
LKKGLKNFFFKKEKGKVNVIIVDWQKGAMAPHYFNATANTRKWPMLFIDSVN